MHAEGGRFDSDSLHSTNILITLMVNKFYILFGYLIALIIFMSPLIIYFDVRGDLSVIQTTIIMFYCVICFVAAVQWIYALRDIKKLVKKWIDFFEEMS